MRRWVLSLNTPCLQNSAESGERSVLTLGSLCLPCCVRDTVWSWFNLIKFYLYWFSYSLFVNTVIKNIKFNSKGDKAKNLNNAIQSPAIRDKHHKTFIVAWILLGHRRGIVKKYLNKKKSLWKYLCLKKSRLFEQRVTLSYTTWFFPKATLNAALNSATHHVCLQNSAESAERRILILGSLCLPYYMRDIAWSRKKKQFKCGLCYLTIIKKPSTVTNSATSREI